ncbi:ephrin type-A receptor 3 isoform X2 [Gasterosteus aculeatus]|uniref:tyrosine-protein kinase receptor TYRO3 isoform X2 n=1 Tax=Gasterosteus aculeatus aculeatus TaxID=481459 RepID=UPI001A995ACB|nr:tyrosine-protein kinase receptor TYRO3 isoform X2 [Gasterosteus aculeatus aculeatus]
MAVGNLVLRRVWPPLILFWICLWEVGCDDQHQAEEEIFQSDKQTRLEWNSDPTNEWNEIQLTVGTPSPVPVLQACGRIVTRTILSRWMERKGARHLLMDVSFAQEEEPSHQLTPLKVYLFDSNTPIARFQNTQAVLDLQTSKAFPVTVPPNQVSRYLNRSRALSLGSVSSRGFHLALSYSGRCVLIASIRLYYRRCPYTVANLASFEATGAASGPLKGSCVKGAVELFPPVRECDVDGVWSPVQGGCNCKAGHQVMEDTCQVCRMGFYKPINGSGECRPCPQNSRTHGEGTEKCDCLQDFNRLPTDPYELGCTKPPSAPVNLTVYYPNVSVLMVTWDPPQDWGGRHEIKYSIKCEWEADSGHRWKACGDDVIFLPYSAGLTNTSVSITEVNPQLNYRLTVQAQNDLSDLRGTLASSTATITIHRWKVPPVEITVTSDLNVSKHHIVPAAEPSRLYMWLTVGVLFGLLLLGAVFPFAVCVLRSHYTKLRPQQELELLPMNAPSSPPPQQLEAAPQTSNMIEGVVQLFEGLSDRLLSSLKEVLVERNKLTLGKELGKGEFGSVYEGVFTLDEGGDIKVAVKTMRVGIHSQEDLHEFLREADIMKNFDHENVVGLLGVTLQREQDFPLPVPLVILPYMKHRDLRRFLIATRYGDIPMFVPHQSLLRFGIDIAAGMAYLSAKGFLHRDLAARNCMLGDDLRVCVADFGLSKKIYSSNYYRQKATIRVPIKWMAIESLSESIYSSKSDVWSFGVTMWEIVSRGRTPYPGVHNHELLELLLSGHRLKPPEDCDHNLYEVMQSCWDKEPSRRPDFKELGEILKGLLSELPALKASQEAGYINHGLEVAAAVSASQDPRTDSGGRLENLYRPSPGGAAASDENVEADRL